MMFLRFYHMLLELSSRRSHSVCPVKTEKKTVQFSEDIQVETIEPEPEPVYIDEVRILSIEKLFYTIISLYSVNLGCTPQSYALNSFSSCVLCFVNGSCLISSCIKSIKGTCRHL